MPGEGKKGARKEGRNERKTIVEKEEIKYRKTRSKEEENIRMEKKS